MLPLLAEWFPSRCIKESNNEFATSSDDNTVKIWDLRKQKSIYTIPAHNSVIPDVHYDRTGEFLLSCSFDRTIKGRARWECEE